MCRVYMWLRPVQVLARARPGGASSERGTNGAKGPRRVEAHGFSRFGLSKNMTEVFDPIQSDFFSLRGEERREEKREEQGKKERRNSLEHGASEELRTRC